MDSQHPEIEQLRLRLEILTEEKDNLQTNNEDLHLELKYALFDSEASKRENNYLRKLLDDKTG